MRIPSKKILLISGLATLVIGVGSFGVYHFFMKDDAPQYPGPTEQEIKEAEDHKKMVQERERIEEEAKNNPSRNDQKRTIIPLIINASQNGSEVFISATINGVYEDGGTCTATITQGEKVVTVSSKGFADATTTSCTPIRIDRSEFGSAGEWSVVVSYSSDAAEGQSQPARFVIQ